MSFASFGIIDFLLSVFHSLVLPSKMFMILSFFGILKLVCKLQVTQPIHVFFFRFCNDERANVKAAHPEYTVGDIAKDLGRKWGEVDEATKSKYEAMAEKDKARYERGMCLSTAINVNLNRNLIHWLFLFAKYRHECLQEETEG